MNYKRLRPHWRKIDESWKRLIAVRVLDRERVKCIRLAAGEEAFAADANSLLDAKTREIHEECARGLRGLAAHYRQAIDLLKAAPMPPKDEHLSDKILRAVQILVSRGIQATAGAGSIAVDSPLMPNYIVRGEDRERWTAEQIADDIERIERHDEAMKTIRVKR